MMTEFLFNRRGRLTKISSPLVMGILNVTHDSFYSGSRVTLAEKAGRMAVEMVSLGADIIDIGACSTRPGSVAPTEEEEIKRLETVMPAILENTGDALISIDTFRSEVARICVERWGVDIINDAGGGSDEMFETVSRLKVAYVLMHTRGDAASMDQNAHYNNVTAEVISELAFKLDKLRLAGVNDVFVDPGFGFAKTLEQNYELMAHLEDFLMLDCPLLVGISRKSMICRALNCTTQEALTGTTALNSVALMKGAAVIRVHDVKEAVEVRDIISRLKKFNS